MISFRGCTLSLVVVALLAVASVSRADSLTEPPVVTKAVTVLQPTKDNTVRGTITFTRVPGGVRVVANVENLTPGDHGFHIHEFGDCSAPDAASAGGHFNPGGHDHGGPTAAVRHAGDLGNLTADAKGKAHYDRVDERLELNGAESIIGRSVIVHEKVDDLKTQPTGAAGARVACGAIGVAKP